MRLAFRFSSSADREQPSAFDAKLVIKGKAEKTIRGDCNHQVVAVARFADMETLDNWYQSAEYQALIPLRDEAVDMTLIAYSVPQ